VIDECGNLGVRVGSDEIASELIPLSDVDQVGVVLGLFLAQGEQLFEQYGHLDPVRRRQRVELEIVFADRQFLFVGGTCNRSIDLGEASAALSIPFPNFRRCVRGGFGQRKPFRVEVGVKGRRSTPAAASGERWKPIAVACNQAQRWTGSRLRRRAGSYPELTGPAEGAVDDL